MDRKEILSKEGKSVRVLERKEDNCLVIPCDESRMPQWVPEDSLKDFTEDSLEVSRRDLSDSERQVMHERFSLICPILPFVGKKEMRSKQIKKISNEFRISAQTIRKYLKRYLVYQDMEVLAPSTEEQEPDLGPDERNIRWALNRFFYTERRLSLPAVYRLMLKERYCDENGELLPDHPSFYQFRYFYRKTKNLQNYYISREGLKNYQQNYRPCVGGGIHDFAPTVGTGMLDATICDIYLVDDAGRVAGRPILTACVDAHSGLCCGYALTWEGGGYSLRILLQNVIADKKEHCAGHGMTIRNEDWPCHDIPGILVTDRGTEYLSQDFEHLTELGVRIINLPSYRAELKGPVEKFFDTVQGYYKPHLKGKGVIEDNFGERGSHDYRLDACLTIEAFERVILCCILFYNSRRVCRNLTPSQEMLSSGYQPYANWIWKWDVERGMANLVTVSSEELSLRLLPRKWGKFSRFGLKVNQLRYHCEGFTEDYLNAQEIMVAYNPDDVSQVWVIRDNQFIPFVLIDKEYDALPLDQVQQMRREKSSLLRKADKESLQAEIDLIEEITRIAKTSPAIERRSRDLQGIGKVKRTEAIRNHKNYREEVSK